MTITRAQARDALVHVVTTVFGEDADGPLIQALIAGGFNDVRMLRTITETDISSLSYPDPDEPTNPTISVDRGRCGLIRMFKYYILHLRTNGETLDELAHWTSLTADAFDEFRTGPDGGQYVDNPTNVNNRGPHAQGAATGGNVNAGANTRTPVAPADAFQRTIKRDPTYFPTLKDEREFDEWERNLKSEAASQSVENVLNPDYIPTAGEQADLFAIQLKYMYSVFTKTVKTDFGKSIVRKHETDRDAQKVYKEIVEHQLKSTKALISSSELMSYITSAKLGDGTWKGSTESFILHWQNQVRLFEKQTPVDEHFPSGAKMRMLQNAVHNIVELRIVKNQSDQHKVRTGVDLDYEQYYTLLVAAAQAYDSQFKNAAKGGAAAKRAVYMSDFGYQHHDGYYNSPDTMMYQANTHEMEEYDESFDIDSPVQTLSAYAHDRIRGGMPNTRLSTDQWNKLDYKGKRAWNNLPSSAKAIILGTETTPSAQPASATTTRKTMAPRTNRTVNLHDMSAYDFLVANAHNMVLNDDASGVEIETIDDDRGTSLSINQTATSPSSTRTTDNASILVNAAKQPSRVPSTDIRKVLSKATKASSKNITFDVNTHITYVISNHHRVSHNLHSLVDRGANGGIAGDDVRVIAWTHRHVDVQGIDQHQMTNLRIATVGGIINTQHGEVIGIFHQYAYTGRGTSIHSSGQLEWYKNEVSDQSSVTGGKQRIVTLQGHVVPITITGGLPRIKLRPYTDQEWDSLPHVVMTDDALWDPSFLDNEYDDNDKWFDAMEDIPDICTPAPSSFDQYGDYRHRLETSFHDAFAQHHGGNDSDPHHDDLENIVDYCAFHTCMTRYDSDEVTTMTDATLDLPSDADNRMTTQVNYYNVHKMHTRSSDSGQQEGSNNVTEPSTKATSPPTSDQFVKEKGLVPTADTSSFKLSSSADAKPRTVTTRKPDFSALRPLFGWMSTATIEKTFENSTQNARIPQSTILKKHYKSPNPALNVHRRDEDVATDYIYSDTPAIDSGATGAQIFVGCKSKFTAAYGCKTDAQFVNALEDHIRDRGAPNRILSDNAQSQISNKVLEILRTYCIGAWTSEPEQQHQNPAERRIQTVKSRTNLVLDRSGAPAYAWLLCLLYVCYLLNYTFCDSARVIPIQGLTGSTPDISPLLRFYFWQEVYYKIDDSDYPSESREAIGNFVGIAEHVGHAMTYKILTKDTKKVICRSNIRPATSQDPNKRADLLEGELLHRNIIKSPERNFDDDATENPSTPDALIFSPTDLIGKSFLLQPDDRGERQRATITDLIKDHESDIEKNPTRIRFKCDIGKDAYEEILTYAEVLEHIERDENTEVLWKFKRISNHEGPLKPGQPNYKGSQWNVMVEWENGEITSEPLTAFAADSPVVCAVYAKEHGLLDTDGWKRFKRIAKREKKMLRMVNQAKLRSYRHTPKYMFGYEVPKDYKHAITLDSKNRNTKWKDCTELEMRQLDEYDTFKDIGLKAAVPNGYKRIRVHLVFTIKHDGRHKARLVADGHLTDVPNESVYSGVVSLRGLRIIIFLAELNGLDTWATDIGNAYLESKTNEKVCITAGPEFGELEGHTLLVHKALYGLRTSGARWHDKLADCLRDMGFTPSRAEADIWMREVNNKYEYIASYVDDLAIASENPQAIIKLLTEKHKFKLKGTGSIAYHLGMDFYRDQDGTLCIAPKKYVEKLIDNFERLFGHKPTTNVTSPIEKGDHPETDTSEFLAQDDIVIYQSLIGAIQWAVSIGRFDIQTATMTLSSFRAAPRRGHLERVKRIYGYLSKMRHAAIRVRTEIPDYSDLPTNEYEWARSVYGETKEIIPKDTPKALGKPVRFTHYVDANLMHDILTGKSVTGILHFINQTPIDWYSKKQATVETATYGSEFVAARTCVEQAIDLRNSLRYLGVPVLGCSFMFGDNKSVVDSSSVPNAKLHKRHVILSFHRVRQAVASKMIKFFHISGPANPADILSKHWGYSQIWDILKPILFWSGDTADLIDKDFEDGSIDDKRVTTGDVLSVRAEGE